MGHTGDWRTRAVFLTSTFRDMHAERDWLRERVFPVLEERLRERRCHLEVIDLRWGVQTLSVSEEEAKELLILKVCLDEVDRSRPFLIGLLGDRYGGILPEDRVRRAVDEKGFKADTAGKSITALEIEYGVLTCAERDSRSHFFFRTPLPYREMPPDLAERYSDGQSVAPGAGEASRRLEELKARIEEKLPGRTHRYRARWDTDGNRVTGLEDFGEMVLESLWADLRVAVPAFGEQEQPTWRDEERSALEEFVEMATRDFVGRQEIAGQLVASACSPVHEGAPWGVCVTGPAGSGKSALLAHVFRELKLSKKPGGVVLAHFAGVTPRSQSVGGLLRRWCEELARTLGETPPVDEGASADDLDEAFASLLHRAARGARVVVLLDALDQLEPTPRGRYLTWLPRLWPENARLIAAAIPGTASEALVGRPGVGGVPVEPLPRPESEEIAHRICARYHRTLHAGVLDALLGKRLPTGAAAAGNPLWLTLAIEELNLLDEDDFQRVDREFPGTAEQRLHQLLLSVAEELPPDVEGLYEWLLSQTEHVWGQVWGRSFANLIALSRGGWREMDLKTLLPAVSGEPWDPARFAGLRRSFRGHLLRRGPQQQYDFAHSQTRPAIVRRNLADPAETGQTHALVASYLETLPADDPMRGNEMMFHLIGAGDPLRAGRYYGGSLTEGELAGATERLAEYITAGEGGEPPTAVQWVISVLEEPNLDDRHTGMACQNVLYRLLGAIENSTTLDTRYRLLSGLKGSLERLAADQSNAGWQRDLSASHVQVGDVLSDRGDLEGALAAYRASLAIAERLAAADPSNAGRQRDLSVSHDRVGDVLRDRGNVKGALALYRASLAIADRLVAADPSNAGWQRDLSGSRDRVGDVLRARGDLEGSLAAYRASLAIAERLAADPSNADWQRNLSVSHGKVGDVLRDRGDLEGALAAYRASLAIRERLAADPSNAGWQRDLSVSRVQVGDVLRDRGDLEGALAAYLASLAIRERLAAADPSNAGWQSDLSVGHGKVGDVLLARGDLGRAMAAYRASLAIAERLAAADPSNAGWQSNLSTSHARVGDVLRDRGNLEGALAAYRASLAIAERLAAAEPSNAGWQQRGLSVSHIKVGDVLSDRGDLEGALAAYRASLAIAERLAAADPSNAGWQRDLSVSRVKVGDVLRDRGDLEGALAAYLASLSIAERLAAAEPSNAGWQQRDLSGSRVKVGDVLRDRGDLEGALAAYRASLASAERLAVADPSNAGWQRDLSVSHNKVGDVLQAQGHLEGALAAYRASLAIRERLAAADPSNAGWQRDLSVSRVKVGDGLRARGDLEGSLAAYRASLAIAERLAAADPSNAGWQSDLSVSHGKVGDVLRARGNLGGAMAAYRASLAIAERLAAAEPSNAGWQSDLSISHARVGDVLHDRGNLDGALAAYRASLAIAECLAAAEPSNAGWQRDLSVSHASVGDVLSDQGDLEGALTAYRASLAIAERLAAADPSNAGWQRDLSVSHDRVADVLSRLRDLE